MWCVLRRVFELETQCRVWSLAPGTSEPCGEALPWGWGRQWYQLSGRQGETGCAVCCGC